MSAKKIIKLHQISNINDEITTPEVETHPSYRDESLGLSVGIWNSHNMLDVANTNGCDKFITVIEGSLVVKNGFTDNIETILAGKSIVICHDDNNSYHQGNFCAIYVNYERTDKLQNRANTLIVIHEYANEPWRNTSDGHQKKVLYQNSSQQFTVGVWQSKSLTTGLINFPYHEFIVINRGELICKDELGTEHLFAQGDVLFIPQGTSCAWQIKDSVSLYFAQIK